MDEYVFRQYANEEDFLEEYYGMVDALRSRMPHHGDPTTTATIKPANDNGRFWQMVTSPI
jgi:hypothetical protein